MVKAVTGKTGAACREAGSTGLREVSDAFVGKMPAVSEGDDAERDEQPKPAQRSTLIPPPPALGKPAPSPASGGFKFPTPPRSERAPTKTSFTAPPRKIAPLRSIEPPVVSAGGLVPPTIVPVGVDEEEPTRAPGMPPDAKAGPPVPDFQRFDPLEMVDNDDDWMGRAPAVTQAKPEVDEAAATGRYDSVLKATPEAREDDPTRVFDARKYQEERPTTTYSKVLRDSGPGSEDAPTDRFPSIAAEGGGTAPRKSTLIASPGPSTAPAAAPSPATGEPETELETQPMQSLSPPATASREPSAPPAAVPPVSAPAPAAAVPAAVTPTASAPAPVAPVEAAPSPMTAPARVVASHSAAPGVEAGSSGIGVAAGVLAVLVAGGGIAWYLLGGADEAGEEGAGAASGQVIAAQKGLPEETPEGSEPEPEPEPSAPAAATPSTDAEPEPEADPAADAEPEPEPEAEPEPKPEPAPEPEAEPEPEPVPADDAPPDDSEAGALVAEATAAMQAKDLRRAYDLAAKAYEMAGGNTGLEVMALSACQLGEAPDARSAYRKLIGRTVRRRVTDECIALGIRIHWDGEGWTSKELLRRATEAIGQGKYQEGYDLAQQSHRKKRRSAAVALMATAACGLKDAAEAKRLFALVSAGEKPGIAETCEKNGIELEAG